jgi:SPX domain protein involved in polyphosphate accumulation
VPVYVVKMIHTRETRASASEIKFVIDSSLAPRVSTWARKHLKADPHGTGAFQDEYETSSLYFDTRDFDVFHRRRSHGRAKYRIRRYGDSDMVFFERKLRKPGILVKRRTVDSIGTVECLNSPALIEGSSGEWFIAGCC